MSTETSLSVSTLPPDMQEAVKTKRFAGKKRLGQWIVFLKTLARFDEGVDDHMNRIGNRSVGLGVGAFLSMFAFIMGTGVSEGNAIVMAVTGAILLTFVILLIVSRIKYSAMKKINLDNSFRETLLPVLTLLSEDILDKGKILLDLNLGDPTDKACKISDKKIPPGRNRKLIERIYHFPAFHAEIPLSNGSLLLLDLVKQPMSYERHYKTARGKYKSKTKWKMLTFVTAGLLPDSKEFDLDEGLVSKMAEKEKMKLKDKKGERICRLTRKIKSKSAAGVPEEPVPPDMVLDMFMKLCTMLGPRKK